LGFGPSLWRVATLGVFAALSLAITIACGNPMKRGRLKLWPVLWCLATLEYATAFSFGRPDVVWQP